MMNSEIRSDITNEHQISIVNFADVFYFTKLHYVIFIQFSNQYTNQALHNIVLKMILTVLITFN